MWKREKVIEILNQARKIDWKYEKFGASLHQYILNPPIDASFVRYVEKQYGFALPEDYFRFITETGDGGAGPDYGIIPFADFLQKEKSSGAEKFRDAYRRSLSKPFMPRKMRADEIEEYAIATRETYERNPDRYYIYEKTESGNRCSTDGFYVLGTHGCQWDFGLIVSGSARGQVFDTDNEGAYGFVSDSFEAFYQNWLDQISDTEKLQKELEDRRKLYGLKQNK